MATNKHIELAKKLAALAKQGVGGEAINAQAMLDRIMEEHNISMDDIDGSHVSRHWLRFEHRFQRLFNQLTARVIAHNCAIWQKQKRETNSKTIERGVDCTVAQYVELEWMLKVYSAAWDEEVRLLLHAFTIKHHLFDPNDEARNWDDLTEEEKEAARRARKMAQSLKDRQIQKQLEG